MFAQQPASPVDFIIQSEAVRAATPPRRPFPRNTISPNTHTHPRHHHTSPHAFVRCRILLVRAVPRGPWWWRWPGCFAANAPNIIGIDARTTRVQPEMGTVLCCGRAAPGGFRYGHFPGIIALSTDTAGAGAAGRF